MKLWAGRFKKGLDSDINSFNSSIAFDSRLYEVDIAGSIIHTIMLAKQNIISDAHKDAIINGLTSIQSDIKTGKLLIDPIAEDIHTFVESELTNRIGDAGKRLHTGRSRNDQVAHDTKTYLIAQCEQIYNLLTEIITVIVSRSEEYSQTIMPGYTHLQRAQPITFGHHLMAYSQMFLRDQSRVKDCSNRMLKESPLGSGALAGTTYPIDRHFAAEQFGYDEPYLNSIDGVSDRDYIIEISSVLSIIMMHLSRFSEEIILWCSWEFKFVELDDAFATGSSIMPQKKNPDIAELVRGKTGRVYGDLMAILTVMKGLPLAYNKDMQEDKESVFDAVDTVKECLNAFTPMLKTLKANEENMKKAASKGFINATDCADYLVKKGLPFREAYKIIGQLVSKCIDKNISLEQLTIGEYKEASSLFDIDVYNAIDMMNCIKNRTSFGGPGNVLEQIEITKTKLDKAR